MVFALQYGLKVKGQFDVTEQRPLCEVTSRVQNFSRGAQFAAAPIRIGDGVAMQTKYAQSNQTVLSLPHALLMRTH